MFFDGVEPEDELRLDGGNPGGTRSIVGAGCDITRVVMEHFTDGGELLNNSATTTNKVNVQFLNWNT